MSLHTDMQVQDDARPNETPCAGITAAIDHDSQALYLALSESMGSHPSWIYMSLQTFEGRFHAETWQKKTLPLSRRLILFR